MTCERCGKEFIKDFRKDKWSIRNIKPRFCSRSCACARSYTEETNRKRAEKVSKAHKEGRCKGKNRLFTQEERKKGREVQSLLRKKRLDAFVQKGLYEKLPSQYRRNLLLEEARYTCQKCGNDTWLGEEIWLEIHHINDDSSDNRKENLIVVCLNCHAILDKNYRNRGRGKTQGELTI